MDVFTDGSSTKYKNMRYGGIGVYFPKYSDLNINKNFIGANVTNQRMELLACIYAILKYEEYIKQNKIIRLHIYSDSMYVINCITKWADKWIENSWKRNINGRLLDIKNLDLIKELHTLSIKYQVTYTHVTSHQKEPKDLKEWYIWNGNKNADILAKKIEY